MVYQNDEFDVTDLDNEKVVMDLENGKYFSINVTGSKIWDLFNNEISVNKIIELLIGEYEVEENICTESVLRYLNDLEELNLIKVK